MIRSGDAAVHLGGEGFLFSFATQMLLGPNALLRRA